MAGSNQRFLYTLDDQTTTVAITMDESNGKVVGNELLGNVTPTGLGGSIVRFEPRYVLATSNDGRITRKIPICEPDNTLYINGGALQLPDYSTLAQVGFRVSGTVGEKKTFASAGDTGQNDGTTDLATT